MEWCFLGKRLPRLASVYLWRLRSVFSPWTARCGGSFWRFWSVLMGDHVSVCHGPSPGQSHLDIDTVMWCSWCWRWWWSAGFEERPVVCSSALQEFHPKTMPRENRPKIATDMGGQCWFSWWLFLGFPLWFPVQSCSVILRHSTGRAANQPKSAF